jgi:hypothetical protein
MSLKPPFNKDVIDNFRFFQSAGYVHPYTCGNCSGVSLEIDSDKLYCPKCDYTQTSIGTLPTKEDIEKMNPKKIFKL